MARVSIVVSHYDRQSLLLEALDSIASQTYRDFEVIVVNDHGADSRALVDAFAGRSSRATIPCSVGYDYRPARGGVAATRNRGVALATGEFVAYLDDDDLWHPHHLEGLVGLLDARPECGLVYGDAEICRMERAPADRGASDGTCRWHQVAARLLAVPFDHDELRCDDFIVPGGMMHRRSLYDTVGPFDETLYVSDDWDWLLRASAVTTFARLERVVIRVRMWPDRGNLSADFGPRRLAALAEIEARHGTPPLEPKTFWEVAEKHGPRGMPTS
jgi:glycosyltransferase involved in cell wall biosynthesis